MKPALSVRGLQKRFGAVVAADALTLDIAAGQRVSLIGANGAGKTTFVNMVTGYIKPDSGAIALDGMDLAGRSPRDVARLGISRSFQIPQLFIELTACENLSVALSGARDRALSFHVPANAPDRRDTAIELLGRFGLADLADRPISELAGGVRKLIDIAMALVRRPKLLLLDEPTFGRFGGGKIRRHGPRDPCGGAGCGNHRLCRARHGHRQPLCRPRGGVLQRPHSRRRRSVSGAERSGSAPLRHRGCAMNAAPLLQIDNLVVEIQSMPALRGFSIDVARGAMVSLVGRNGAGKTTLLRSIMGHLEPAQGTIRFDGADLASHPRHARAALGIGYMPEDRCLVPQLTVEENILLPLWVAKHLDRRARLDFVYQVIGELAEMRHRKALLLSGGQQKLVALGRALGIGTRCLLLDEPFEGIAPVLSERLSEVLASLKGGDLTLLMSQSDMNHSRGLIDVEFTIERGANV